MEQRLGGILVQAVVGADGSVVIGAEGALRVLAHVVVGHGDVLAIGILEHDRVAGVAQDVICRGNVVGAVIVGLFIEGAVLLENLTRGDGVAGAVVGIGGNGGVKLRLADGRAAGSRCRATREGSGRKGRPRPGQPTQMAIQTGVPSERPNPLGPWEPEVLASPLALFLSMVLSAMCSPRIGAGSPRHESAFDARRIHTSGILAQQGLPPGLPANTPPVSAHARS